MKLNAKRKNSTRIPLSVPHLGGDEKRYVEMALEGSRIGAGEDFVVRLEEELSNKFGCYCLPVSSGTAAIHLGLKVVGVEDGDEVVVPTQTFAATCNPVLYERATPVLIDSDPISWTISVEYLSDWVKRRAKINRMPRAVVVVDLFGQCADIDAVHSLCAEYGIAIVEDAAHSIGGKYKDRWAGTLGDVGSFSFNGNKLISAGGGGVLVSGDESLIHKARFLGNQAKDVDPSGLGNYLHSELGYNYRMSNILAAVALGQFSSLDQRVDQRRAVAERYRLAVGSIPGLSFMPDLPDVFHTHWLSCITIDQGEYGLSTESLVRYMASASIEVRPVWRPMHCQVLYRDYEYFGADNAERIHQTSICLPSSGCLTEEDQMYVIERLADAPKKSIVKE